MAKPIVFSFEGTETSFGMNKVDRARLYGYKQLEVVDDEGHACELATLADDGRTLVGKGGTGIGYLSADGNWCVKEKLRPVNLEGDAIIPVKSSFGSAIQLEHEVTIDEYLDHSIRLVYRLEWPEQADRNALIQRIRDGGIFRFSYSYRGGLEADTGFLIANDQGEIFMLVGDEYRVPFVGLQQVAAAVPDAVAEDDELMDFGMI